MDNDSTAQESLRGCLSQLACSLELAESFEQAVQLCQGKKVSLIILSVELSSENGYAVFKRLQKEKATMAIPVIMVSTAERAKQDFAKHASLSRPAAGYLIKPLDLLDFLDLLSELVLFPDLLSVPRLEVSGSKGIGEQREALEKQRLFYRDKISKLEGLVESLKQEVQSVQRSAQQTQAELEKERQFRKRLSSVLADQ
jgi:CheY-like chemotaxis protein